MPSATMTMNIGVSIFLPSIRVAIFGPWKSGVTGNRRSTHLRNRFSLNSSSSVDPSRASLTAV